MGNIGTGELMLIFLVALLVFGAKRIPEIARGLGHGIREFKGAMNDIKKEITVDEQRTNAHIQPPQYGQNVSANAYPQPAPEPAPAVEPKEAAAGAPGASSDPI